ncbi:2-(3-amino-3-carboxypropyl)histidine synthase subunit 2 [Blattella germanica]|nr:2-(3-amino-3-carboxypropyl)histidine synthase subunit 2 [Blattella germanica]
MALFSSNERTTLERTVDIKRKCHSISSDIDFYYEIDRCEKWIREHGICKICLQFPDDLLHCSVEVALRLEKRLGIQTYILGDTSYGSCCVDIVAAQHVNADGIIHFGHACLSSVNGLPVLYIFEKFSIDIFHVVSQFRKFFKERDKKILLFYDVDYHHAIGEVVESLSPDFPNLIVPVLASCSASDSIQNQFNILGRSFTLPENATLEVYSIAYIGKDGRTLSNVALTFAGESLYVYDPSETQKFEEYKVRDSKFLMKRFHLVERVKDAQTLGILVGTLGICNYLEAVSRIKQLAKRCGKKCYIVAIGKPNVEKLANFPEIEVFVLVACSENSLLDSKEYYQPIVTPYEVELACNENRTWSEKYVLEFQNLQSEGPDYQEISDIVKNDIADVSLVTGRVRMNVASEHSESEISSQAVAMRSDGTVSTLATGSLFFTERSWQGLKPNLGQNEVVMATRGRSGIPSQYDTDHDTMDKS